MKNKWYVFKAVLLKKKKKKTATEICFWAPEAHFKSDDQTAASHMRVYYQRTATESYALV